jgi:hypothetical protein
LRGGVQAGLCERLYQHLLQHLAEHFQYLLEDEFHAAPWLTCCTGMAEPGRL